MKIKIILITLLIFYPILIIKGQELFIDKASQDTCLFIGGIKSGENDLLKVFEDGEIIYKSPDELTQVGLLVGSEFTDELFKLGLCFELNGYEPFWNATIYEDNLCINLFEKDNTEECKINLYTSEGSLSSLFFAMFSSKSGNIFGTINNIGLTLKDKCRVCEYDIAEDEDSLYEVYINIYGKAYKGCGTIRQFDAKK